MVPRESCIWEQRGKERIIRFEVLWLLTGSNEWSADLHSCEDVQDLN